ncbi:hypothetical protein HY605_00585 [Candidatus Peregrinibacteria bacterium]|nr:hypothetical protein [Candidatus Peregrinibacteria bacterium]
MDSDGKEVESHRTSTMWWGEGATWTYALKKDVEEFTIEITCWKELKTVEFPLKLKVSVGL